jgi:hypothetical protein
MNPFLQSLQTKNALTANGAVTHSTSLNKCLDFFFVAGSARTMDTASRVSAFIAAFAENQELALKILFWSRDLRGGAGQRCLFQDVARFMNQNYSEIWDQLIIHIEEYGYWKDIFVTETPNDNNLNWLSIQLEEAATKNLLAKWFPRKGPWFVAMHKYLKMTPKEFRKKLVSMTNVVETAMCSNKWSSINYSQVPSVAMKNYTKTFNKHDESRFQAFIQDVKEGNVKVNAGALYPHDLVTKLDSCEANEIGAYTNQWNALPNYMEGSTERILPICDVSGSMTGLPMEVSVALGLYISERNEGPFKDAFITFDTTPKLQYLQGSVYERMVQLRRADWGGSTDLQATFRLVLDSAVRDSIPVDQMPTKLLIISDMEFNSACDDTNLEAIQLQYQAAGYPMPELIFWNVNARLGNVPAQASEPGIGLVSGFSPSILKSVLQGKVYTPTQLMLDTVMTERYARIRVDI